MTSIREVSSIAEDLVCSICLSIFQEPYMLGCGHNFCLSCLESYVISKDQHQGMCPECRCPFSLQDAARNRVLANLAEKARLLKLEEGAQSDGGWYFCEEHEERLKLFCSEDEALVCVICRDLPQHQGHSFLPIKNATKDCQGKLKESLESLEDGMKWAASNQSLQQEAMEELESLSQHLYGHIFIEFESLRQLLDEKEQTMMDTVKQMSADNQADMERRLEYLKAYESSHAEISARIRAALEEPNEFALLKGIKELMGQIQNRLEEDGNAEHKVCAHDQRAKEMKENATEDKKADVRNETESDERDAYGAQDVKDAQDFEDRGTIPVDPALGELEWGLDFETCKEMLGNISIWGTHNPDSSHWFQSPEEDASQSGDSSIFEAVDEEATSLEDDWVCAEDVTSVPDEVTSDQPLSSSSSDAALPVGRTLHSQPPGLCTASYFPVPAFQPVLDAVQRWVRPIMWRPNPRRGWATLQGRGTPVWPLSSRQGQGRGFQSTQTSQHIVRSWRSPRKGTFKPRGAAASGQGRGWFNKQNLQPSGSSISGQRSGGKTRSEQGLGQGRGSAPSPGRGGSGQGRGSAQKGPTHHSRGQASSNKGPQNRQASHRGGCGRGSGLAKGSRGK